MRFVLTAAALLLSSLTLPASQASAEWADCNSQIGGGSCEQRAMVTTRGTPASSRGRGPVDPDYVSFPAVVRAGDRGDCMAPVGRAVCTPDGLDLPAGTPDCLKPWLGRRAPELRAEAQQEWSDALGTYRMCPATGGEQTLDPLVVAIQAWQDVPLPKPEPYIAPGWMITGKYAYLETRGERQHTFTTDTPLGPLTLEATGRYYVDWGDGRNEDGGPFTVEGRPWPDGEITHTYIDVGLYDVVVTEEWTATWRVAGFGGQLGGMRTEGRIPGFRVEQIQVVVGTG